MTIDDMRLVVEGCHFISRKFEVEESPTTKAIYLRASYYEEDVVTGKVEQQYTRRWLLSPEMSKSEIVATCFKCVITSMEHQVREWFTYKDKAIYHPHYDVDQLWAICDARDHRE